MQTGDLDTSGSWIWSPKSTPKSTPQSPACSGNSTSASSPQVGVGDSPRNTSRFSMPWFSQVHGRDLNNDDVMNPNEKAK